MVNCEQKNLEKIVSNDVNERFKMAKQGFFLDKFVYDGFHKIRKAVAEQGYGFEKLINDEHWCVRLAIAKQGYGLNKFVYDDCYKIRVLVAKQRYGLSELVNDKHWCVRLTVAKRGYGLDKLIDDYDEKVKKVARKLQGAKTYVLPYKSGAYNENIYLYIFNENKYEITSYYYSSDSLEQWKEKCIEDLNENVANKLYYIMRKLIEA